MPLHHMVVWNDVNPIAGDKHRPMRAVINDNKLPALIWRNVSASCTFKGSWTTVPVTRLIATASTIRPGRHKTHNASKLIVSPRPLLGPKAGILVGTTEATNYNGDKTAKLLILSLKRPGRHNLHRMADAKQMCPQNDCDDVKLAHFLDSWPRCLWL